MSVNTLPANLYPRIILIGPTCAGKSTISSLLGTRLNLPVVSLDEIGDTYYAEAGFDKATTERMIDEYGFGYFLRKWQPALAHATARIIEDNPRKIVDLGAGHTHYEDRAMFEKVKHILSPCPNVVLLLPSPDLERSVELIRARNIAEREWDWKVDGYDYIEHWIKDTCNHELATMTVFTDGQTPEQTSDEILGRLR